jgi:ABC-type glycerol-3-phosphate transport system substrate-binding protein
MRDLIKQESLDRRKVIKLISLGGIGGLAGCGGNGSNSTQTKTNQDTGSSGTDDSGTSTSEGVGLTAWAFANHADVLAELAESYTSPHTVEAVDQPPGEIAQKLVTSMQSQSNLPSVSLLREGQIRPFALNGGVVNLDDIVREYEDRLYDLTKQRFRVEQGGDPTQKTDEGQFFGIPNDLGPMALVYNTEVFDEAGLPTDPEDVQDEIQTWDQFISAGETVNQETEADMMSFEYGSRQSSVAHTLCTQAGGLYYNEDGEFAFDQEANIKAMEQLVDLTEVNRRETWNSDSYISGLKNNEIATIVAPFWYKFVMRGLRTTRGTLQEMEGVWRVIPIPRIDDDTPRASNFGGVPAAIPAALSQEQIDAARDFGEYWHLSEDAVNQKLAMGAFPAIKPEGASELTAESEYFGGQQANEVWVASAENCPPQYLPPNQTVRSLHFEAYRRILEDEADIEQTLSDINDQMLTSVQ